MKKGFPPGPYGHFLTGNLRDLRTRVLDFFSSLQEKYGDISIIRFSIRKVFYIQNPDMIRHVLQENNRNYTKSLRYEQLKYLLGNGLLTSEGEFWLRQRRMIQPAFHKDKIEQLCDEMVRYIRQTLTKWDQATASGAAQMNVSAEMMALTLGIVGKTLLNTDVGGEAKNIGDALAFLLRSVNKRTRTPLLLPLWVPVPEHLKIRKSVKRINTVLDHVFEERRNKPGQRYDLLSMLMESTYEDTGMPMSDRQLRDEVMTIFMAGHETTANALSWTFYLLATHPDVLQKLMDEIFSVTGDRDPEFRDLHSLKYLTMVIEESMRLYPPAWIIGRKSIKADILGEYTIPPGYNILICAYALHRDKRFWHNPEKFVPERFNQEEVLLRPKFSYIPFGGGPRLCIGNSFAMMEMQLTLVMVLKKFRLELLPETDNAMEPLITLRPEKGILLKITRQSQTQNSVVRN